MGGLACLGRGTDDRNSLSLNLTSCCLYVHMRPTCVGRIQGALPYMRSDRIDKCLIRWDHDLWKLISQSRHVTRGTP
jgi:hypothetical protein